MDILNSDWLIRMLKKSSQTPHGRLLGLFDILEDWLDLSNVNTPELRKQFNQVVTTRNSARSLQDYLAIEAAKAGAAMPETLASQLYFMAVVATQEKLNANNHQSLSHAKSAASALISAQTKKEFQIKKSSAYAAAASFTAVLVVAGALFMVNLSQAKKLEQTAMSPPAIMPVTSAVPELEMNPEQTVALMAQIELMRRGNCQLIEAIQLPDNLQGIYLNMIVHGQVSTDPYEQKIAMELLHRTRCNYTPMLMANSRN